MEQSVMIRYISINISTREKRGMLTFYSIIRQMELFSVDCSFPDAKSESFAIRHSSVSHVPLSRLRVRAVIDLYSNP